MRQIKILFTTLFLSVCFGLSAQITNVNIGTAANSGNGDPLRTAFIKLNENDNFLATNKVVAAINADNATTATNLAGNVTINDQFGNLLVYLQSTITTNVDHGSSNIVGAGFGLTNINTLFVFDGNTNPSDADPWAALNAWTNNAGYGVVDAVVSSPDQYSWYYQNSNTDTASVDPTTPGWQTNGCSVCTGIAPAGSFAWVVTNNTYRTNQVLVFGNSTNQNIVIQNATLNNCTLSASTLTNGTDLWGQGGTNIAFIAHGEQFSSFGDSGTTEVLAQFKGSLRTPGANYQVDILGAGGFALNGCAYLTAGLAGRTSGANNFVGLAVPGLPGLSDMMTIVPDVSQGIVFVNLNNGGAGTNIIFYSTNAWLTAYQDNYGSWVAQSVTANNVVGTTTNTLVVSATGLTNSTANNYLLTITSGAGLALKDGNGNGISTPVSGDTVPLKPGWRFTGTAVTAQCYQFP
jgi:hypothetical protein